MQPLPPPYSPASNHRRTASPAALPTRPGSFAIEMWQKNGGTFGPAIYHSMIVLVYVVCDAYKRDDPDRKQCDKDHCPLQEGVKRLLLWRPLHGIG